MENINNGNGNCVVRIEGLSKRYSHKGALAVKNINLTLNEGEIVGMIGANGAGKSTTLKCLTGMLAPSEGEIYICGFSIKKQPVQAKRNFSFVTDNHSVFEKMTGAEYLSFMADAYGVPDKNRKAIFENLENYFRIGDNLYKLIGGYSHGTKQKICMMGSLMHFPKLWILDEPMLGLDPVTMNAVCEFMRMYKRRGHTVLFSSHNLETVTKLCDRIVAINKGELVADMPVTEGLKNNPSLLLSKFYGDSAQGGAGQYTNGGNSFV